MKVAINLIVQHVQTQLVSRGFKLRSKLAEGAGNGGQYILPGNKGKQKKMFVKVLKILIFQTH